MATLLTFPPRSAAPLPPAATMRPPALPATGGRRGEYAIADIARSLGMLHRPVRAIINALRVLARHDGMPLPRTPRIMQGKPVCGPASIVQASRWDAGEIDAWLDGRGPAPAGPALATPVREQMRERALALGLRA